MSQPDFKILDEQIRSADRATAKNAEAILRQLADARIFKAAEILSTAYSDGFQNIPANYEDACRYSEISAEAGGDDDAGFHRYWLAELQYRHGDYSAAMRNARMAHDAGQGSASAVLLAQMLLPGLGCNPSIEEGLSILEENTHSSSVSSLLARIYIEGKFVPKDTAKALKYIQSISDNELSILSHTNSGMLGQILFIKGTIVRDVNNGNKSEEWMPLLKKSAALGNEEAKKALASRPEITNQSSSRETLQK